MCQILNDLINSYNACKVAIISTKDWDRLREFKWFAPYSQLVNAKAGIWTNDWEPMYRLFPLYHTSVQIHGTVTSKDSYRLTPEFRALLNIKEE